MLVRLSATVDRLTVALARACCGLPHLAQLSLSVGSCDPEARQILAGHAPLAWLAIEDTSAARDIHSRRAARRAARAPERFPPLDGWEDSAPE
jgi:hypothetical protein